MRFDGTTIVAVRRNGITALAGDGQVTQGESVVMKATARKVRRIYNGQVLVGFAGSVADAFTLSDLFESKLEQHAGNLTRAAVALAQQWRRDRAMSKLEALLIVASADKLLVLSGNGEVIEPDDDIAAIGSGGNYALAAARAFAKAESGMSAAQMAESALHIAADICVYTNHNVTVLEL